MTIDASGNNYELKYYSMLNYSIMCAIITSIYYCWGWSSIADLNIMATLLYVLDITHTTNISICKRIQYTYHCNNYVYACG